MKGYHIDIEKETLKNKNFRKVAYTGNYMQLVYMSLKPGEEIGMETHGNDQFFRIEGGTGVCIIDGNKYKIKDGSGIVIPAGAEHNVINTGKSENLAVYTLYAVPHHKDGYAAKTKAEADASKEEFDGKTTE